MNNLKTVALLALLGAILMGIGFAIGNLGGLIVGFVIALVMNGVAYWMSDRIALMATGAREVTLDEEPELHRLVEEVAALARLPKPRLAVIQSDQPNAFATGRNPHHAVVAVTTGIRRILDERELMAVLGHELGHVRNRDILIGSIAAVIAAAISFIAYMLQWSFFMGGFGGRRNGGGVIQIVAMLATIILAPLAAMIIRMAITRAREYGADETGAHITGTPLALASALEKLEAYAKVRPMKVNPATSHLFIVNPLRGRREGEGEAWFVGLFLTHPPISKRIERLNEIARRTGMLA